jgi:hypothetical protein
MDSTRGVELRKVMKVSTAGGGGWRRPGACVCGGWPGGAGAQGCAGVRRRAELRAGRVSRGGAMRGRKAACARSPAAVAAGQACPAAAPVPTVGVLQHLHVGKDGAREARRHGDELLDLVPLERVALHPAHGRHQLHHEGREAQLAQQQEGGRLELHDGNLVDDQHGACDAARGVLSSPRPFECPWATQGPPAPEQRA